GPDNTDLPLDQTAIIGSEGADTVLNFGVIAGIISMNGGNDVVELDYPQPEPDPDYVAVEMGSGDDRLRLTGEGFPGSSAFFEADGGEGYDTYEFYTTDGLAFGGDVVNFEVLVLGSSRFHTGFSGFLEIRGETGGSYTLIDSLNPLATLELGGSNWRLRESEIGTVIGTDADERFTVNGGSRVLDGLDLGGGNDELALFDNIASLQSLGEIIGGAGEEDLITVRTEETFFGDFSRFTGFETMILVNPDSFFSTDEYTVSGINGLRELHVDRDIVLNLSDSDLTNTFLSGGVGGSISIASGITVRNYSWSDVFPDGASQLVTPNVGNTIIVTNAGTILENVYFIDGDDLYDGTSGSVGGEIRGNAGNDTLLGGVLSDLMYGDAGADTLNGGGGVDTLFGGAGSDAINGGSDVDTAGFDGELGDYTITQTSLGVFEIVGEDGTDILTNVEFARFDDQTIRLRPGEGVSVNFDTADPGVYQDAMNAILDFDGN
ncbi:MAG: hypothetical protein SXU28_15300, partial [Pseudomonadota bacterium]|nr:hypothetical protein [Pseudomonadota bacterium]